MPSLESNTCIYDHHQILSINLEDRSSSQGWYVAELRTSMIYCWSVAQNMSPMEVLLNITGNERSA